MREAQIGPASVGSGPPAIELRDISKTFGTVKANRKSLWSRKAAFTVSSGKMVPASQP